MYSMSIGRERNLYWKPACTSCAMPAGSAVSCNQTVRVLEFLRHGLGRALCLDLPKWQPTKILSYRACSPPYRAQPKSPPMGLGNKSGKMLRFQAQFWISPTAKVTTQRMRPQTQVWFQASGDKKDAAIRSRRRYYSFPPKKWGWIRRSRSQLLVLMIFTMVFNYISPPQRKRKNELSSKKAPEPLANFATTCENHGCFTREAQVLRCHGYQGGFVAFRISSFSSISSEAAMVSTFSRLGRGKVGGIPATRCSWDVSPNSPNSPPTSWRKNISYMI